MKPLHSLFLQFIACLTLLLASLPLQAQEVDFNCRKVIDPQSTTGYVDLCKASNVPVPVVELSKFATSLFDFLDTPYELPLSMGSNCYTDTTTDITQCSLSTGAMLDQAPLYFNCTISPGSPANFYTPSASCTLNNPNQLTNFEQVMTMDCTKVQQDTTKGSCKFNLNRKPILGVMKQASNYDNLTPNQRAIHEAFWTCLNRIGESAIDQSQCDMVLMSLMNDPTMASDILSMVQSVTPNNTDRPIDISSMNTLYTLNNIVNRLSQLRNGYAANSVNVQYFDGHQWLDPHSLLAANNMSMNDASPEKATRNMSEYGRLGLFLNATAINSDQTASLTEQSADTDTLIATIGMDYRFTDTLVAGLAINATRDKSTFNRNSGKLDNDSTALVVYGSYYIGDWYLDANINYGQNSYDQERNVYCKPTPVVCPGGFYQSFTSDFAGTQTLGSIASGYQWRYDALSIQPFVQLNMATLKTDGYTERPSSTGFGSGDKYALTLGDQKRDTSTIKLGTNFQYAFPTNHGVFIPLVGLYGVHEFENNANVVTGHFIGNVATDAGFNLATNDVDSGYFIVAAGLNFQLKNGNAGFINIQSTQGYDNLDQTQITAGWRWEL